MGWNGIGRDGMGWEGKRRKNKNKFWSKQIKFFAVAKGKLNYL